MRDIDNIRVVIWPELLYYFRKRTIK